MASSLAVKRFLASGLLSRSHLRPAAASSAYRSFNTDALRQCEYDEGSDDGRDGDRRLDRRPARRVDFFTDAFDPFSTPRSLRQILNTVDQLMNSQIITPASGTMEQLVRGSPFVAPANGIGAGARCGWDAKETEDALHLRVAMPGLGKEDVKISVEKNTLSIRGEGPKENEEDSGLQYSSRFDLPEKLFKIDQIKAEMKNGVLKVSVPKLKEEERSDVFNVKVD